MLAFSLLGKAFAFQLRGVSICPSPLVLAVNVEMVVAAAASYLVTMKENQRE